MESMWILQKFPKGRKAWILITVNEAGEVLHLHARVDKVDSLWYWVTQPPHLQYGKALTHDEARTAAENVIRNAWSNGDLGSFILQPLPPSPG